jgi:hypothetical protein
MGFRFHLDETPLLSSFINYLSCHKKILCGSPFIENKTLIGSSLISLLSSRINLAIKIALIIVMLMFLSLSLWPCWQQRLPFLRGGGGGGGGGGGVSVNLEYIAFPTFGS